MTAAPIHALVGYYERLANDPGQEVAQPGFSREKISHCLVLAPSGELHSVQDLREEAEVGGRTKREARVPKRLIVPDRGGRSGTLLKANFLWDNTGYALGADGKGKPQRSAQAFEAFRALHQQMLAGCDDPGLRALCKFLDAWSPQRAVERIEAVSGGVKWDEICDTNVVFKLQGEEGYLHDSPALQDAWAEFAMMEEQPVRGFSLVSGRPEPLARLHPMIKGVAGAQSSGAALVSFNLDAFESYEKQQSFNAPVGITDAFRYTTALNRLLADPRRRVRLADATLVFWAGAPTAAVAQAEDAIAMLLQEPPPAEDAATVDSARLFLQRARDALVAHRSLERGDTPFYILGLSPNAARLAVRFWLVGTVQQFTERLLRHLEQLEIVGGDSNDPFALTLKRIVLETARPRNGWPDEESVSPLLAGAVLRSVLSGAPYPQALLQGVLDRIRAEGFSHKDLRNDYVLAAWRRAAILKACLIRNHKQEVTVSLNPAGPRPYQLGRLFAVLEKTQEDAFRFESGEAGNRELNATIKDRSFASASTNPVAAFPRLLKLHAHHLRKLQNKPGLRTMHEKLVQEICGNIGDAFPRYLPPDEQGQFFLGYYHQRQELFTKKSDANDNESTSGPESKEL